jgi:GNAT superfamily N-acetyltransferase
MLLNNIIKNLIMRIKLVTHKEVNALRKLKINKNFKDNFTLFKMQMIENNEILGAFSYSKEDDIHEFKIDGEKYKLIKPVRRLEFIEVKPSARGKKIAKEMLTYAFELFSEMNYSMQLSNIVLNGESLIPLYKSLSEKNKVDLLFGPNDKKHGDQIFHVEKVIVKKPSLLKRIFRF